MFNFNHFKFRNLSIPTDYEEKKKFLDGLTSQFVTELNESEVCQNYFKKYNVESVAEFVRQYAETKTKLVESLDYYMRISNEDKNEDYLRYAREALGFIQQKKLFSLQLQWRADQLKIEEVKTSYDFEFWEKQIEYCPFIPAITENEFELMKKFLQQHSFKNLQEVEYWQSYSDITDEDEDGDYDQMPDWYLFYDQMFGTGKLLLLPDIRGEKEDFYLKLAREADKKKTENENKDKQLSPPYLPSLFAWDNTLLEFANTYESDPHFKELFRIRHSTIYPDYEDKDYERGDVDDAIDILEAADRPIILPSNMVWYKAIITASEQYVTQRTLEAMDSVYEEYQTLAKLGIKKHYTNEEKELTFTGEHLCNYMANLVLTGRELNGEPRDFNF